MRVGANKKSSWTPRWLKLEACIPNLNQGSGIEKAFMRRIVFFLEKINGFLEEKSRNKKICDVCLYKFG